MEYASKHTEYRGESQSRPAVVGEASAVNMGQVSEWQCFRTYMYYKNMKLETYFTVMKLVFSKSDS